MSDQQELRTRVAAVERLAKLFRIERFVYLGVTSISFLLLLWVAGRLLFRDSAQIAEWSLLLGSSGLITVTTNRVLQMWSQALRLVAAEPVDGAGAKQ